jgi:hypothetical protein
MNPVGSGKSLAPIGESIFLNSMIDSRFSRDSIEKNVKTPVLTNILGITDTLKGHSSLDHYKEARGNFKTVQAVVNEKELNTSPKSVLPYI